MNTAATKPIAHEAEVQRQHVRLQLPIKIIIREKSLDVIDWSNSGVAFNATPLKASNIAVKTGDTFEAKLNFDFQTFELTVPLKCEVRHVNADGTRVGCRFSDMNERNISIMQYLVSAYISGDLVQVGDMLDVVSRKNFTTPRKVPAANLSGAQAKKQKARNLGYSLLVAAVSLFLLAYAGSSIYERVYVVEAESATVSLANIGDQSGTTVVEAIIAHDDAVRLARGMDAALGFPGYNQYFSGKIYEVFIDDVENHQSRVYIVPNEQLPDELVRSPVDVKIDVF